MSKQRARLEAGEWYLDDAELQTLRRDCWRRLDLFNAAGADEDDVRQQVLRDLLGEVGRDVEVVPRFQCSYGYNVSLGDRAFVNANAFVMDDAPVRIGSDVRIGPGARLVTALHPVDDPERRREGWERALPIEIGSNAWLGTSVTVCAGVRIGADSVIGAGSVVLDDVPDRVVAAGSPARVIREVG